MLPLGTANTSLDDRGMGAYLVFLMCSSLTHQSRRDIGMREVWTLHQAFSLEAGEYLITVLGIKIRLLTSSPWTLLGVSLPPSEDQSPSSPPGFSDTGSREWLRQLVSAWPGLKLKLPTGTLLVGEETVFFLWCLAAVFCLARLPCSWSFE